MIGRGYSYTWEGDRLVHLVTSNRVGDTGNYTTDETMHFHYDAQGKPSMLMYNGTRFGYVYNAQGDVIGIITGGLTEKVKYTYDAWGRLLSITGSSANTIGKANPFRYRAYIYDQECGLYYLRTRYYNPNWCRFINADTLIGKSSNLLSHNTYSYCRNTVISASDKDGMDAIWILDTRDYSHASLLLQDTEGRWWYYYWGANLGPSSSGSLQGMQSFASSVTADESSNSNNLVVHWDPLELEISGYEDANMISIQNAIKEQYGVKNKCVYTKGIYFEGDFSKSWEDANNRNASKANLRYSVLIDNCAQTSLDILAKSINNPRFSYSHYQIREMVMPKLIHTFLVPFGKEF